MQSLLIKTPTGLSPAHDEDFEALKGLKVGEVIKVNWTRPRPRNVRYFRKWWALAKFAYEHWEPGELDDPRLKGVVPEKSFERFRKDLTILAGHYEAFYRVDNTVKVEAKSIAFWSMSEDEFDSFYNATVNAVLKHILKHYKREDLEQVVESLMLGFG
jgi:hypothetical protein